MGVHHAGERQLLEPVMTEFTDAWYMCYQVSVNNTISTLTHWGEWCIYASVSYATITSDNGLLSGRRYAIIWTNAGILLIGPFRRHFSGILIQIQTFSFKKMHLEVSSA